MTCHLIAMYSFWRLRQLPLLWWPNPYAHACHVPFSFRSPPENQSLEQHQADEELDIKVNHDIRDSALHSFSVAHAWRNKCLLSSRAAPFIARFPRFLDLFLRGQIYLIDIVLIIHMHRSTSPPTPCFFKGLVLISCMSFQSPAIAHDPRGDLASLRCSPQGFYGPRDGASEPRLHSLSRRCDIQWYVPFTRNAYLLKWSRRLVFTSRVHWLLFRLLSPSDFQSETAGDTTFSNFWS